MKRVGGLFSYEVLYENIVTWVEQGDFTQKYMIKWQVHILLVLQIQGEFIRLILERCQVLGLKREGWRRGEREIIVGWEVTMCGVKIEEFTKSGNKFVQMLHCCVYVGSLPMLQVCAVFKWLPWLDFSIFRNTAKHPILSSVN